MAVVRRTSASVLADVQDGAHIVGNRGAGVRLICNVPVVAEGHRIASSDGGPWLRRQYAAEHQRVESLKFS